jgi:hypothetical protein
MNASELDKMMNGEIGRKIKTTLTRKFEGDIDELLAKFEELVEDDNRELGIKVKVALGDALTSEKAKLRAELEEENMKVYTNLVKNMVQEIYKREKAAMPLTQSFFDKAMESQLEYFSKESA